MEWITTWVVHTGFHCFEDDWQLHDNEEQSLAFMEMLKERHGYRLEVCNCGPVAHSFSASLDITTK